MKVLVVVVWNGQRLAGWYGQGPTGGYAPDVFLGVRSLPRDANGGTTQRRRPLEGIHLRSAERAWG